VTAADLVPWLAQGGVVGILAWVGVMLHRSAIRAHEQRADDWHASSDLHSARADERSRQLMHVLAAVASKDADQLIAALSRVTAPGEAGPM
jgi:hypothetical protein